MARPLRREDYAVGWVCALPIELAAAQEMLDVEHDDLERKHDDNDESLYALGSIGGHNVAIVCLPGGRIGNNPAAAIATQMRATFKGIRFGLLVGVGGGAPSLEADIRLGDVVVSQPHDSFAGVVQYDIGESTPSGFKRTGSLNSPPQILLEAVTKVQANELRGRSKLLEHISRLERISTFQRRKTGPDVLFEAAYEHEGGQTCEHCSADRQQVRPQREDQENVVVHYGTIASGNQVIKDASTRDKLRRELGGVLCFEMEAAGLMNSFPCLVIRGICDYADSHKNKQWQAYAAVTAAAYAKEILSVIPAAEMAQTRTAAEVTRRVSEHHSRPSTDLPTKRRRINSFDGLENNITDQQTSTLIYRPHIKSVNSTQLSPQEEECLKSLSFSEQEYRYDDIYTARDTCQWLLENSQYQTWTETTQGLFWVKGNPGAGKSVLMKFAIKKMRERKPGELIMSFFIHGQGTDLQKTPLGIFRALLNSMLKYFPTYLTRLTATFEDREQRFGGYLSDRWKWTAKELQEVLLDVLTTGTKHRPVTIFVDALDECGESSARSLLAYFTDIANHAESESAQVKICLSSRHYPILGLDSIPAIHVEEWNNKDIQWFTRERLRYIQLEKRRQQIENEILSKAQGGFQWVFLVTEIIIDGNLNGIRTEKLQEKLASCPETLSELYAALLSGVSGAEQFQMVKLFQWVLFAERPLSAQELRDALATDKDMSCASISDIRAHEGWSNTLVDFERYVKHISRGLVHFQTRELWEQYVPDGEDSDREAQLIHQSVADYLIDRFLHCSQPNTISQVGVGHFQISRSCLKYLALKEVLEEARLPRGTLSAKFPLAPYAAQFLLKHIQKVEQEGVVQSDLLMTIQWEPESEILEKFADLWRTLDPDSAHIPLGWPFIGATAFHILAALGSRSAFNLFLEMNDGDVDLKDSDGNTPLLLAIREGHQDIALMLIDQSIKWKLQHQETRDQSTNECGNTRHRPVDVNAENNDGDTALNIALAEEAEAVIFKLIEAGADLKYTGREMALVRYAINNQNRRLLAKLIEKNLNLDGAVYFALKYCLSTDNDVLEEIIFELLTAGGNASRDDFDINVDEDENEDEDEDESRYDNEAIHIASRRGQTSVVNMLLSHGVSASSYNDNREFPLQLAVENGFEEIARRLLQYDPSIVEMEDVEGHTALEIARQIGQANIIKLILEEGRFSTVSTVLEEYLLEAVENGASDLVEAVLRNDRVAPDCRNSNGETPLLIAAQEGQDVVVKLLLESGKVNADFNELYQRSPLSWAAENGHEAVVKLLVDTGKVDVDLRDFYNWTPLFWAIKNGHEAVVKLLVDTGKVDVDSKDSNGWTLLLWAAYNGHEAAVKLLVDTSKVDVDLRDSNGRTPLLWAAYNGHEAAVKLLVDTGKVDVDSKDSYGWTPLLWAAQNGHGAVVKLLLDKDPNLELKDSKYNQTPLSWATQHGHEAVVKLLLDKGADLESKDNKYGQTPLLWAAENGHEAVVKLLLDKGADLESKDKEYGQTPLLWAAENGHEAVVKLLLDKGADLKSKDDRESRTPLSWAARNGHEAVVKLLVDTGKVDVDSRDFYNWTPLLWAAKNGHEAVVELLLKTGKVNVDSKGGGVTPLLLAVKNGHEAVVKLLLDTSKAGISLKCGSTEMTPLSWAAHNGHKEIVKLLLRKGIVDVNERECNGQWPLLSMEEKERKAVVELLLEMDIVDVNAKNSDGWTPLLLAAGHGDETTIQLLLENSKTDVDVKGPYGRTPLWWAVLYGHEAAVKLLLHTGRVDVNAKDDNGETPILWAAQNGREAIVQLLLDTGKVNDDVMNQDGQTPLHWATRNKHEGVVKLLRAHLSSSSANEYGNN